MLLPEQAEHTMQRSSITTQTLTHTRTHAKKKEINESYANVFVAAMTHTAAALLLSLTDTNAMLSAQLEIGTRRMRNEDTPTIRSLAANSAHFQLVCMTQHAHARMISSTRQAAGRKKEPHKMKLRLHSANSLHNNKQQSRKQKIQKQA